MKLGFFTDSTAHGGGGRVCSLLSQIWTRLGHDVQLFAENDPHDGEYRFDCVARETVHQHKLTPEAIKLLHDKYGFEVAIIIGRVHGQGLEVMLPCLKALGVKTVGMLHHSFSTWLYMLCIEDEYKARPNLEMLDCLVCVDPMQAIWWHELGAKALCISNPVVVKTADAVVHDTGNNRLVWVGRAEDPGKRLDLMVEIFARVLERIPEVRLSVLGNVADEMRHKYMKQYGAGVCERIDYVGFVSDVPERLKHASIHVFTSILEVAVPQVVLEAQAAGLPTVTMDMPVLWKVGESEGVIKCRTPELFAAQVIRILTSACLRKSLGEAALECARRREDGREAESSWRCLFNALHEDKSSDSFIASRYAKIDTREHHLAVIHEAQRAFAYFCENHFRKLRLPVSLRCRAARFLRKHLCNLPIFRRIYELRDAR